MRILHVTSIINHHQLPLARSLVCALGEDSFRFVATRPLDLERMRLGWSSESPESWILRAGENQEDRREFEQWFAEADVVLCSERLMSPFSERLREDKLTFYMSERWWKPPIGMGRLLHPRFASMALRFAHLAQCPSFHFLPKGSYAASDMRKLAPFPGRMWNWGYFTSLPDPLPAPAGRESKLEVLWAGRMLSWKRVDTLVRAFTFLRQQGVPAHLTLIGDGPCRDELQRLVRSLRLADNATFYASMPVAQVRQQMRTAHIYVLPSNGYEGWGAVVNEAMSEGCVVVASSDAGSAKTMIRHGQNGLLFETGNWRQLGRFLCQLAEDEPLRLRLAKAGQRTIADLWSPKIAAERFLVFSEALLAHQPVPHYAEGPLSRA